MKFSELFQNQKPLIGMIHTNSTNTCTMLELAKREIEIYLKNDIYPLIENYFGSSADCEEVLEWMQKEHPDAIYGVNILGDYREAFRLAKKYGAKFIQIDSVCGHLRPKEDEVYANQLELLRRETDVVLLGGVRFKYQAVRSGRSVEEDLRLGMERCDAIVCTGEGTGQPTPFGKVQEFKKVLGDFPVIVGAGVTLDTIKETFLLGDGAIVGSWFKDGHRDTGNVNEEYVCQMMERTDQEKDDAEYEIAKMQIIQMMGHGHLNMGKYADDVDVEMWLPEFHNRNVTILCDRLVMDDIHNNRKGFLILHTGTNDLDCLSLLNLEQQSSGFKIVDRIEDNFGAIVLEVTPSYVKDELIIPDNPWLGFSWGQEFGFYDDATNSIIHPLTSKKVPISTYGHLFILNFTVSGEFNLDIYYIRKGDDEMRWIFSKSFCCK